MLLLLSLHTLYRAMAHLLVRLNGQIHCPAVLSRQASRDSCGMDLLNQHLGLKSGQCKLYDIGNCTC
jgi:hypothetical protein